MEDKCKFCSTRMPKDLHNLAKLEAYRSGMTLQEFIIMIVKERLKNKNN
jgi:hypothetical protein